MSDIFADLGRLLINPQYYFTMIIVGIVIVFVIYALYTREPPPGESREKQLLVGGGVIALAVFIGYFSTGWRGLVKTNDRYARISGLRDIFYFLGK